MIRRMIDRDLEKILLKFKIGFKEWPQLSADNYVLVDDVYGVIHNICFYSIKDGRIHIAMVFGSSDDFIDFIQSEESV